MLFSDASGNISSQPPMISFLDHGFLFGDSLYEVVRLYDGKIFAWPEHIERFVASGKRVGIPIEKLLPELRGRAEALVKTLGEKDAALRMIVTRGVGKLHIDPRTCAQPDIYMAAWRFDPATTSKPVRLAVVNQRRNSIRALDPAIKSGNYLNSVLAFKEAVDFGYDDAIFLNDDDELTELTTSNFGWVRGGKAYTTDTGAGILHGVTRRLLLESEPVVAGNFSENDLKQAEEVFALSTFKEVLSVEEVRFSDGSVKKYPLGPQTARLARAFRELVTKRLSLEKALF